MAFANSMTKLINKIDRALGTAVLNLPPALDKTVWEDIIISDTLETFSLYYPHVIPYTIVPIRDAHPKRPGYYFIDEATIAGVAKIIGVRGLVYNNSSGNNTISGAAPSYVNTYDMYSTGFYNSEDVMNAQIFADSVSMTNHQIYYEVEYPNLIKVTSALGVDVIRNMPMIAIELYVQHPDNLLTIAPTKMEYFKELATLDIKKFLYASLKHFDNLETIFGTIELKIDDWSSAESDRRELVKDLEEKFISAGNKYVPLVITV